MRETLLVQMQMRRLPNGDQVCQKTIQHLLGQTPDRAEEEQSNQ